MKTHAEALSLTFLTFDYKQHGGIDTWGLPQESLLAIETIYFRSDKLLCPKRAKTFLRITRHEEMGSRQQFWACKPEPGFEQTC